MIAEVVGKLSSEVKSLLNSSYDIGELNETFRHETGILDFFKFQRDLEEFKRFLDNNTISDKKQDLGDFQTPSHLTDKICEYLTNIGFMPDIIFEPTCGEGNFVISAMKHFPSLRHVYCVELQSKYEWLFKLKMLNFCFEQKVNVAIEFHRDNIFTHQISERFKNLIDTQVQNLLILGNPPWVTNSELSTLDSDNLPTKVNIKRSKGIEAITGKGNFDIAEFIILQMLHRFPDKKGKIVMLCKTSVIRNIVKCIRKLHLRISNIQELLIDAKREFNISVDAAVFIADLNSTEGSFCTVSSLYQPNKQYRKYGWVGNNFASNIELYDKYKYIDGYSALAWRQGVKHDAAKVMVLEICINNVLINGFQDPVDIEETLLYPFVKGTELKKPLIDNASNKVIITQTSPNETTGYIASKLPKTWSYLISYSDLLDKRKSVVYKSKPRFSLFGIGDYSFKPYKVAVSGFYKEPNFSLIPPIGGKPVMLDDTCYYLSFDEFREAFFTWVLLSTDDIKKFLSSIVFLDSKRPYTKEILMRIDILKLVEKMTFYTLSSVYHEGLRRYIEYEPNEKDFLSFKNFLRKIEPQPVFNV